MDKKLIEDVVEHLGEFPENRISMLIEYIEMIKSNNDIIDEATSDQSTYGCFETYGCPEAGP